MEDQVLYGHCLLSGVGNMLTVSNEHPPPPKKVCLWYDTKLQQMVKLQFSIALWNVE